MITHENIKEVLSDLSLEEITTAIDSEGDFVGVWVRISNVGFYTTIEGQQYNEQEEQEHHDNGQLYLDKDDFLNLLGDNNINH